MAAIRGIAKTSLWTAWKEIRSQLKNSTVRDVIDYLEYDIDPNVWINRLLRQIQHDVYEPRTVRRFNIAKSKGFDRQITQPAIPDLVLYRAIVDHLYNRARHKKKKHIYSQRRALPKAV